MLLSKKAKLLSNILYATDYRPPFQINPLLLHQQPPPFEQSLLEGSDSTLTEDERIWDSLPASYLTTQHDLASPIDNVMEFLQQELDLGDLGRDSVLHVLRSACTPTPCNPLHHLSIVSKEIHVTELMDSHLLWSRGTIFIKPLPRYLLLTAFWLKYLSCEPGCSCASSQLGNPPCTRQRLHSCAVGFLYSYAALVAYEVDFIMAKQMGLLPQDDALTWTKWNRFIRQLRGKHLHYRMHRRFWYGDIQLSLPTVRPLSDTNRFSSVHGGFTTLNRTVLSFWKQNLGAAAGVTVFLVVILTAMQVGLTTNGIKDNSAFNWACYVFTVFSILSVVVLPSAWALDYIYIVGKLRFIERERKAVRVKHLREKYGNCL